MTENRARAVEEPVGYDYPPTDRIPVPGDLSNNRPDKPPADADALPADVDTPPADAEALPDDEFVTDPTPPAPEPATPVESLDTQEFAPEPVAGSEEADKARDVFGHTEIDRLRGRWRELQASFVDDPAQAVRGADDLVDEIMRELAERKEHLEGRWRDGLDGPGGTEELRVVIREYRAFFDHLLNA
jgi:hypothetical protein